MSKVLVFQHVAAEPLGTLDALIRERGHRIRFVNFSRQPDAHPDVTRYAGLIVLGGPMNVGDTARHPHLVTELRAIEKALTHDVPVLGICLGSQLLAHALGARVYRADQWEIGWYRKTLTAAGETDPVTRPLVDHAHMFQWHAHTFDLPQGAERLVEGESVVNQGFRYQDTAYGFQFHMEMDAPLIERWLNHPAYREELANSGLAHGPDEIRVAMKQYLEPMQRVARDSFGRFLDLVGRPIRRRVLSSRMP